MNNVIERVWIDISSMSVFRMYNFQFWGFFKEGITLEARIGKYIANLSSIFNLVKKILLREKKLSDAFILGTKNVQMKNSQIDMIHNLGAATVSSHGPESA